VKRTTRLLLKSFLGPFVITFLVALFFLDMQFLWVYADELIGKGLAVHVVLELLLYASARLVNLALPLAILMSSIMTLGSLAEHHELTALKSSGMRLGRIMRPLVVAMCFVAGGALLFANHAWPVANLKFRTLLYSVTRKKPTLNLENGVFYNGIEGYAIRAGEVVNETGALDNVLIHHHGGGRDGAGLVIKAKRGTMRTSPAGRFLVLDLEEGASHEERLEPGVRQRDRTYPHLRTQFDAQRIRIDLSSLDFSKADEALFKRAYEMMSLGQLAGAIDSLEAERTQLAASLRAFGHRSMNKPVHNAGPVFPLDTSAVHADWLARLGPSADRRVHDAARDMLRNAIQTARNQADDRRSKRALSDRHAIEWHRKLFLSSACILLFLIGAPLGAIIRKGGLGLPTVLAILLFVLYYIITIMGERMVRSGALSPAWGMWMGTMIMLPAAFLLNLRAAREFSWRPFSRSRSAG
jgi:lipopolysaccharide export system permease protein